MGELITNRVPADLVRYKTPAQNLNGVLAETITMNAFIHRTLQLTMDNKEPKRCSLKVGLKTKLYILSEEEKLWELIKRVFLLFRIMHLCEEQQNTTLNS